MQSQKKQAWIKEGYQVVAKTGFNNINIKSIALTLKKSKSSFYHYFGDKVIFEADLLHYHLDRVEAFSQEVSKCEKIRARGQKSDRCAVRTSSSMIVRHQTWLKRSNLTMKWSDRRSRSDF